MGKRILICCSYLDGADQGTGDTNSPAYEINYIISKATDDRVYVTELYKGDAAELISPDGVFVFLSSYSSNSSTSCLSLVKRAIEAKMPTVTLMIDDCPLNNEIKDGLCKGPILYHYKNRAAALARFDKFIKSKTGNAQADGKPYKPQEKTKTSKAARDKGQKTNKKALRAFAAVAVICALAYTTLRLVLMSDDGIQYRHTADYIAFEYNEDSNYGLVDKDGNLFASSFYDCSPVINGYFVAMEDEGDSTYFLCKMTDGGYEKIAPIDGQSQAGMMNDGLMPVCDDSKHIHVIDSDGNLAYRLDSVAGEEVASCFYYSCGRLRVNLADGKYVYLDKEGKRLFGKSYFWANDFDHGYAVVCIDDDGTYALIDTEGETLFTFDCHDPGCINISASRKLLSTIDGDDRTTIYDFTGKRINTYTSKVHYVYAFGDDCFVFHNDDEEFGLISYDGEELIWAKYDLIVPNGDLYLAIHPDDDDEIRLIDEHDRLIKTLDGYDIYDFHHLGYDFPNMISRPDGEVYIVDDEGNAIGGKSFDGDLDTYFDLGYYEKVRNLYFPTEHVLSTVMSLCGQGSGIPAGEGAFFYKDKRHCYPADVKFLDNAQDQSIFSGSSSAYYMVDSGLNYQIYFGTAFDEPIVRDGENTLSDTAWLKEIVITIVTYKKNEFKRLCQDKLKSLWCTLLYSNDEETAYLSNNEENVITLNSELSDVHTFTIHIKKRGGIYNVLNNVSMER